MSAVRKLPENPTNKDLADSITDLHQCLDDYRAKALSDNIILSSQIKSVSDDLKVVTDALPGIKENQEDLKSTQSLIINAFNISATDHEPTDKAPRRTTGKPIALMSQREALTKGAIAFGSLGAAVFFALKLFAILAPFLFGALLAMYKAATG